MTEQEQRERAIEEMANIARDTTCFFDCNKCLCKCEYYDAAEMLYDAGYSKADKVRKETAIEYSNKIDEIVDWCISNKIGDDFDYEYFSNCLRNLKKHFSVEVEE